MRRRESLRAMVYFVALSSVIGAIVHLGIVLLTPLYATRDAYARLAPLGDALATVALGQASPSERLLPYADPAVAMAFCRYDLSLGPLRVHVPTDRAGLISLSFHSMRGNVFYALTDKAAQHGGLDALIATPEQMRKIMAADSEDNPSQDLRVAAPAAQGFVFVRAFSELPGLYGAALAQAKELTCEAQAAP